MLFDDMGASGWGPSATFANQQHRRTRIPDYRPIGEPVWVFHMPRAKLPV